jgi:hypothetical protein
MPRRKSKWEKETARAQWVEINRTLTHFNEIIHRTRQLTATVVLAAFGAALAAFSAQPTFKIPLVSWLPPLHVATVIIMLGLILLAVGYAIDRGYYFKLLLAAVGVAERLEQEYKLPAKLTLELSESVSRKRARITILSFYGAGVLIGLLLALFINYATAPISSMPKTT